MDIWGRLHGEGLAWAESLAAAGTGAMATPAVNATLARILENHASFDLSISPLCV